MGDVLQWAAIYVLAILLVYTLKCVGLFRREDRAFLSNLVFFITLPAFLVSSFSKLELSLWLIVAFLMGLLYNVFIMAFGAALSRKKPKQIQPLYIIDCPGLNVGGISLSFLQNFFPAGIPYLCMFDTGDSCINLGTSYAVAESLVDRESQGVSLKSVLKNLACSVPFLTYVVMIVLALFHWKLPAPVLCMADFLGKGNPFLMMALVGLSLELKMDRRYLREIFSILAIRYGCAVTAALVIFNLLPLPLVMRQSLAVAMFSAMPNATLIYTNKIGNGVPVEVTGALCSITMVLTVPLMALAVILVR